ncbi:hypothetical protein [Mycolicibacter heraklionensis]|uniref:hypothetical protein n=1 Tax=Mycolicibacter heraklionensis TaxID=512402 RepID=UPI000A63B67C|nr:hypothetical protein [Mycolicibacter heraklionensis]
MPRNRQWCCVLRILVWLILAIAAVFVSVILLFGGGDRLVDVQQVEQPAGWLIV